MTTCNKFQPTVLEGQLCYSLDVARLMKIATKPGKNNGLFLLLDPHPYHLTTTNKNLDVSRTGEQSFKVFIHSLAQYSTYGPGSYGMSSLKKMSGTKSFEQLPDHQKKCHAHNRDECQTQKYLEQVEKECKCIPWSLGKTQIKKQVKHKPGTIFFLF